jgi:hypothetical protein
MPSYINASSTGTGGLLYGGDATGNLELQTNGSTALTVTSSGRIGIGNTAPTYKFEVEGTGIFKGITLGTGAGVEIGYVPGSNYGFISCTDRSSSTMYNLDIEANQFRILRGYNSNASMVIDSSGNVGIGTNSPVVKLDVNGSIKGTITANTAVATTSGTVVNFSGIPSWAKRITVILNGISTNGTSQNLVQIGSGGTIQTTGYLSYWGYVTGSGQDAVSSTAGFGFWNGGATDIKYGTMTIVNISDTTWVYSLSGGFFNGSSNFWMSGGGRVTLSGALNVLRLTIANGTDVFDLGSVNIFYEG